MILQIALMGMVLMEQSHPDLVVEPAVSLNRGGTVVSASLKNKGKAPLRVVLDDYFCQTEISLFDAKGKKLEAWDQRATEGARLEPEQVKAIVIRPGAAVEFGSFSIQAERASARAGPLSWELQDVAGQTLQVEFAYSLEKERAERAAQLGAAGAETGRWTSRRVEVATTALTAKEIRAILSEKREVNDAGAIPLLIEVVEKAKDGVIRQSGAVSLGNLRATAATVTLAALLRRDKVRDVRISAAVALGSIASIDALDALIEASRKDEDDLVRFRATEALARLSDERAVDGVIRSGALRGDQMREMAGRLPPDSILAGARRVLTGDAAEALARRGAVDLLAELKGDGPRLDLILRCVNDSDAAVRLSAVRAAIASKNRRVIGPLIGVAGDPETGFETRSGLKTLTDENPGDDGAAWKKWWEAEGKKRFPVSEGRKD